MIGFRNWIAGAAIITVILLPLLGASPAAAEPTIGTGQHVASVPELARALKQDPDLIYQYVHDHIEYNPFWGLTKGAYGAMIDGNGTAFDIAHLMVELLRESGFTAHYVIGTIRLTPAQFEEWYGVAQDRPANVANILSDGSIPYTINGQSGSSYTSVDISHVWVRVQIGGTYYHFDPSRKAYQVTAGIDLENAIEYSDATFMSQAGVGATLTSDYYQAVNRGNIRSELVSYADNLVDYIRDEMPAASLKDVIGGKDILPSTGELRDTALPHLKSGSSPSIETGDIPASYEARIKVTFASNSTSHTMDVKDVYGRRLTVFYDAQNRAYLSLDGVLKITGGVIASGSSESVTVEVDHQYPSNYAKQSSIFTLPRGIPALIYNNWGPASRDVIEKYRNDQIKAAQSGSHSTTSETAFGLTMAVIAATHSAVSERAVRILDRLGDRTTMVMHRAGMMRFGAPWTGSQPSGLYLDLPLLHYSIRDEDGGTSLTSGGADYLVTGVEHMLMGSAISQTQTVGGVSAIDILDDAAQQSSTSSRIYYATSGNWTGTVSPALTSYISGDKTYIQSEYINNSYAVVLPRNGNLGPGGFAGTGYIARKSGEPVAYEISGRISAAVDTTSTTHANVTASTVSSQPPRTFEGGSNAVSPKSGGVALISGDLSYGLSALRVGSAGAPIGLSFDLSYNSGGALNVGPLGRGWGHPFGLSAKADSDAFQALGEDSAVDSAAVIAGLFVANQRVGSITGASSDLNDIVIMALTQKWVSEQIVDNVVNIAAPGDAGQFVKLADGSYNPPPGSAAVLTKEVDGSYKYKSKSGATVDFDTSGRSELWTDAYGNDITLTYNGSGQLTTIANDFGRSLAVTWQSGRIWKVTGNSAVAEFGYDGNGNLITYKDPAGQTTTFAYNSDNMLTKVYRPDRPYASGGPDTPFMTTAYDTLGRVETQTDAAGKVWSYFLAGVRAEIENPLDGLRTHFFNAFGRTVLTVDELERENHVEYDGLFRVTKQTFPLGNSTEYEYDGRSNVTKAKVNPVPCTPQPCSDPSSIEQTFTYDTIYNQLLTSTDALGRVTNYEYVSGTPRLDRILMPAPVSGGSRPTMDITVAANGLVTDIYDPTGIRISKDYSPTNGNLMEVVLDPGGDAITTSYTYDAIGNALTVTDPNGNATTYTYDALRRVTQTTGPSPFSLVTETEYDPVGRVTRVRAATGDSGAPWQTTETEYTVRGHVEKVTDPSGEETAYQYDDLGRLIEVTDPAGRVTQSTYDSAGQRLKSKVAVGTALAQDYATLTYDANGRQTSLTDARGYTTAYSYDVFGRAVKTTYPSATTPGQTNGSDYEEVTYDVVGNVLTKRTRAGDSIEFDYDRLNRLIEKIVPNAPDLALTYDAAGRMLTASDTEGRSLTYSYDDDNGRLLSVATKHVSVGPSRTVSYQYDEAGNRTRVTWPDSYYVSYEYDQMNRVKTVKENGSVTLASYTFDQLSRRTAVSLGNGGETTYVHDIMNRLEQLSLSAQGLAITFDYGYNEIGQLVDLEVNDPVFKQQPSSNSSLSYAPNGLNQYTSISSVSPTYDNNGNLTQFTFASGQQTYTYDPENRLVGAVTPTNTASYAYDPAGRRASKTVNSVTTDYLSDGAEEIAEYDRSTGSLLRRYVYGPGVDERIATVEPGGGRYYYQINHQRSTVAITNDSGAVVESFRYDAWGASADSASGTTYRYTGRRFDEETGLYYYRARYYSSELGRFLQTDPIGMAGGTNMYAYTGNAPVLRVDAFGLEYTGGSVTVTADGATTSGGQATGACVGCYGIGVGAGGVGPNFQFDLSNIGTVVTTATQPPPPPPAKPKPPIAPPPAEPIQQPPVVSANIESITVTGCQDNPVISGTAQGGGFGTSIGSFIGGREITVTWMQSSWAFIPIDIGVTVHNVTPGGSVIPTVSAPDGGAGADQFRFGGHSLFGYTYSRVLTAPDPPAWASPSQFYWSVGVPAGEATTDNIQNSGFVIKVYDGTGTCSE